MGVARVVQEHVRVEVAPRELADEGRRAVAVLLARPRLELAHRDAAEVDVRGELRGAARQSVVAVGVGRETVVQEGVHARRGPPARRPASGRAARARARRRPARGSRRARARGPRQRPRGAEHLAARDLGVPAGVGRVDRVRAPVARPRAVDVVDHERARHRPALDPRVLERAGHARVAARRERRHVAGEEQRRGPRLRGEPGEHLLRAALAHEELAVALAQRGAQLGERLEQEVRARRARVLAEDQPAVEHEDAGRSRRTRDAPRVRDGLSCTRRSRRNQTMAREGMVGEGTETGAPRTAPTLTGHGAGARLPALPPRARRPPG